jgi:glycosyltransferase involved in cell wall biosynthesis
VLSIVAIGKNEAEHIPRLLESVNALRAQCDFPIETIFVDSASTDDSVAVAKQYFDTVVELKPDPRLCASAGRHAGTLAAQHPWVFYIDADMEICEEFFPVIAGLTDAPSDLKGIIGAYVHRFDNGTVAFQGHEGGIFKSEWAGTMGGASILRRDAVLEAGNWDPGVFGKEEMNLYARLGGGKRVIRYVPEPMIYHFSEFYTPAQLFYRLLFPGAGQGKVFYGYGQSVRALWSKGSLGALIRLEFEQYLCWLLVLAGIILATRLPEGWGLSFVLAEIVVLAVWMGSGPVMRYLLLPINLALGWRRYSPDFRPVVRDSGPG